MRCSDGAKTREAGYHAIGRCSASDTRRQVDSRPTGTTFDAAGNETKHGVWTVKYDGENRIHEVTEPGVKYEYNGEGRRVTRTGYNGAETVYVYDHNGELAAEYTNRTGTGQVGIRYLTSDQVGSTRLVTDSTGAVVRRMDYTPFGRLLEDGVGARTAAQGYQASGALGEPTQKFGGKERDPDTRLDYLRARYMSSSQGRFTSPDEPAIYADPENPQSWNLYGYGLNNPLVYSDPDGHDPCVNNVNPSNGNICTDVTASAPDVSFFARALLRSLSPPAQVAQQTLQLAEPAANWLSQPGNCAGGWAALGGSVGWWAGGVLGSLAGTPFTAPLGATGGAVFGGTIGGLGGSVLCSTGGSGGSGGDNAGGPAPSRARAIQEAAAKLGYDKRIPPQKAPFKSHGQSVFTNGKTYITPDVDGHIGGVWKMFDRTGNRLGTFDANLKWIGK